MAKTKGNIAREYVPFDATRAYRKINERNRKGINNPYGQEPSEVTVADFDAAGDEWDENFRRELEQERLASGE